MPSLILSNDGTYYLVTDSDVNLLGSMARVSPWTAMGVKTTSLTNGDIGEVRATLDAQRLKLVNQVAAASALTVKAAIGPVGGTIDVQQLATLTAQALAPLLGVLPDGDVERIAEATADLFSTRLAQ